MILAAARVPRWGLDARRSSERAVFTCRRRTLRRVGIPLAAMHSASVAGAVEPGATRGDANPPWTIVAIGDSTPAGWGHAPELAYPSVYGVALSVELGVESEVVNHATGTIRTVAQWAERVRSDEGLARDLTSAQVVLVWLGWHDILPIVSQRTQAYWPDPLRAQLEAKNAELRPAWRDLLTTLRAAGGPSCAILVADTGLIGFLPEQFGRESYWPELKRLVYLDWRCALLRAAEEADARVIPTMAALGGPDGEGDLHPELLSADGLHFNAAGHRFLADLHRTHDGIGVDAAGSGDPRR
jgi:lysophospholipase L1-like esterase